MSWWHRHHQSARSESPQGWCEGVCPARGSGVLNASGLGLSPQLVYSYH